MNHWILEYDAEAQFKTIQFTYPNRVWDILDSKSHLEEYGAVRSFRYHLAEHDPPIESDELTFYVEFEEQQVATKLLSRGYIYLKDIKICINSIQPDHHNHSVNSSANTTTEDPMLKPSPDQSSLENILHALNDDCLRSIFNKMHLINLWSVANVCVRFRRLARENLKLKYHNRTICFSDIVVTFPITLEQIKKFFIDFGPSIDRLKVDDRAINLNEIDDILRLINEYCTNIKKLAIEHIPVNDEILVEVRPLLSRLKSLQIECNDNRSFYDLISACSQLEYLMINHLDVDESISSEVLAPKLTTLRVYGDTLPGYHNTNYLQSFLKFNPQLTIIEIISRDKTDHNSITMLSLFCEHLPNVQGLFLHDDSVGAADNFNTTLSHLNKLKNLDCFSISSYQQNVAPLMEKILENDIKLRILRIVDGSIDDHATNCISRMKSIENLDLRKISGLNRKILLCLVKRLPKIHRLNLEELVDFVDIPEIVALAKQLTKLRITHKFGDTALPKSIEKDFREMSKVIKKRDKPLDIHVVIDSLRCTEKYKSFQMHNEWLTMELLVVL